MKNKIYLIPFFIMLLFWGIYSCRKDSATNLGDPNAPMSKEIAQNYYYNTLEKQPVPGINDKSAATKPNHRFLMFDLSYTSETPEVSFIEIPLRYNRRTSSVICNDTSASDYATRLMILNASFDRLLIYKIKGSNKISQAIVTYIPDLAYLQKHNNDISSNNINKLDTDFNGYLKYKQWDGNNMFILKIVKGKIVGDFVVNNTVSKNVPVKSMEKSMYCTTFYDETYVQHCYSMDPEGTDIIVCTDWVLESATYSTVCTDVGANYSGDPCHDYGYCNVPTPPVNTNPPVKTNPPPTTSTADKKLPHPNTLPANNNSLTQVGATCVFMTMQWVSQYFGGTLTVGQALAYYANIEGKTVPQIMDIINNVGISSDNLNSLVSNYFNTTPTNNLYTSINDGYPIMGTLDNGDGTGHEVMITGYNKDGTCEYFDPQLGIYKTDIPGHFYNVIAITGKKNNN